MTENVFNLKKAFTWKMTGKMEGMISLSTSCTDNALCQKRQHIKGSVCEHCYAEAQQRRWTNTGRKFRRNGETLKNHLLTDEEIDSCPINNTYCRLEAFGDIETVVQVTNYFNICRRHKGTHFTLWTKNPWLIFETEKTGERVPKNLKIGYSSPMVNHPVDYKAIHNIYPFISFVFNVFTKEFAQEHHIKINCGGNHCLSCLLCYANNRVHVINEILK